MSIEQLIRVAISGIVLYVMLVAMGEMETLKWMALVIGLAFVALGLLAKLKRDESKK